MNILRNMIYATLLYVPFFANATTTPVIDGTTSLSIPQHVAVYSFTTEKSDVLKNIIREIGQNGYATSTTDLSDLDNRVVVFRKLKSGDKLTPSILKPIISKQADIKSEWYTDKSMPYLQTWGTGKTEVSIRNSARSKTEEGNISLSQEISILDDGFERHSFKDFGVTEDGSVINILMIQPGKYFVIVTTI